MASSAAPAYSVTHPSWAPPSPSHSASAAIPPATPCPPEAPQPEGALAWVSGCKILIRDKIVFETNKERVKPQSFPVLDAVGDILSQNSDFQIEVQGHLGAREQESYGRDLSKSRARSIHDYLIKMKGIEPSRIEAKGYGGSMPLADSKTEEGRAINRRIEFVIWKWRGGSNRVMWPGP
jgi:outer membrane protein OmpA-like peptidoglycan-associated protein